MLNGPEQCRERNTSVSYNSIDVYLFIDFANDVIRTSVSVNVPQLEVYGVTIRNIFVLRTVSGFSDSYGIHNCQSLPDKSPAIFDRNTLFHAIKQLRRFKISQRRTIQPVLRASVKTNIHVSYLLKCTSKIREKSLDQAWLNRCSPHNHR